MRKNLLRVGFVLILLGALLPATAGAHTGGHTRTSSHAHEGRVAMPKGWSAGEAHRWTGYSRPGGSRRVRELQRRLNRLGYRSGPVDGLFGPVTERATKRFQARNRLRVDGIVGPRTLQTLRQLRQLRERDGDRTRAERPLSSLPRIVPERVAPQVQVAAPVTPGPELPLAAVLAAFALLGIAAFVASYMRTDARIRELRGQPPRRLARVRPAPRHQGGGG